MNSRFTIVIIVLVAIFGGIFFVSKNKANAPNGSNGQVTVQPSNHTKGEGKKSVTLVEYGDFQCPACGAYYPIVEQVVEKYKSDITFQFRNFPISNIHPNAMAAHRAAEAAGMQGKYWEMYGLLYQNQSSWQNAGSPATIFQGYASSLGLNIDKYRQDVAGSATNAVIQADIKAGTKLGVTGTPTFFIDGKKIDQNPQDLESFNKLIENAIANKSNGGQ
jgi:protein-disulfide isomerase